MKTWYKAKVAYSKEDEQGRARNVTEEYLMDALSFTEAEAKIHEEMKARVMGSFQVKAITKSRITDVFEYDDSDVFYQCKLVYMISDADSGREKKEVNLMLIHAHNVQEAYERVHDQMNNLLVTFSVPEVKESLVLEVFHHVGTKEEGGNGE
jgi:hypothetical protein